MSIRPAVHVIVAAGLIVCRVSTVRAEETPADIRALFVNAAAPVRQELAAVIDLKLMGPEKRQLQAIGPQGMEPAIFLPADFDGGKGAAADAAAVATAVIAISGCIKKNSVVSFLSEGREEHGCLSFSSRVGEVRVSEVKASIFPCRYRCNYQF
jgi:hypothetical protein